MPNAERAPALGRGLEDALDLGLVEKRDDRRDADADRHARARQRLDRADAPVRRGGARLEDARQCRVERGDRHVDRDQSACGHRRDQVEVALDARGLGHERERMRALGHHLDDRAGDQKLALDRLVRIGRRADVDRRRHVGARAEGSAQALGGIDLGDDSGLEVDSRRHPEVAVRRPREAVDAAVLAAAVRIDREVEAEVGRVVLREDRLDALLDHRGLGAEALRARLLLERSPAVVVAFAGLARIAVLDRPHRSPAFGGRSRGLLRTGCFVARDRALALRRCHAVNIYSIVVPCQVEH